jgi:hypothetical protein
MRSRVSLSVVILGILSLGALVLLAAPPRKPPRGPHQEPLLPRKEVLQVAGRGYLPLVVDYLWIQLIQATGRARKAEEYRDVYPYAELITDLDPRFDVVYRFAGTTLPTNLGRETWVNTEESTRIIRKGLPLFPDDLRLNILLAYNLSTFHHQYREAAQVLEKASKLPEAPEYLSALATRLYAQSGEVDSGLALARSLAESAEDAFATWRSRRSCSAWTRPSRPSRSISACPLRTSPCSRGWATWTSCHTTRKAAASISVTTDAPSPRRSGDGSRSSLSTSAASTGRTDSHGHHSAHRNP